MTKRRRTGRSVEDYTARKPRPEPKLTRLGYLVSVSAIVLGLIAELVIAYLVSPSLPAKIPAYWIGHLLPGETAPSWMVWLVFPIGQLILLAVALHGRKVKDGKSVTESGKAWTLVVLAVLFVILQASAFNLPRR